MANNQVTFYSYHQQSERIRLETDLLGTRYIPYEKYWGIHTLRALENFQISNQKMSDVPDFIWGMITVKKASAMANKDLGVLSAEKAEAIVSACNEILTNSKLWKEFPLDLYQGGAGTSINMNVNEVITNVALEQMGKEKGDYAVLHPNDDVNKSQSTNCAYPTGFRIALYKNIQRLTEQLAEMQAAFEAKAKEFKDVIKMGRTQLQDAVPMTLGQEFQAYAVLMKEEIRSLNHTSELLLEVNLGATAIGTGVNTPKHYAKQSVAYLAQFSGFPTRCSDDLIEATSDCGAYVMVHSAIKRLAVKLSKISNDLRLLSSGPRTGLNEINLPQQQAGSSIMPAKVNPVIPELVNQVCFKVIGNDTTITMAAEAGQLQLNAMEPIIAQSLFESINLLKNALSTLEAKCISGITANKEVCAANVENSIGIVTYLTPVIGHHHGDEVGRICAQTGKSVREVALELNLISEIQINALLNFEHLKEQEVSA